MKHIFHSFKVTYGLIFLVLLLVAACSTKKNTFTRRAYHNLTGHYNTYWNGGESYKEAMLQMQQTVKDNYNKILLVYNYGTQAEAQGLNSNLDRSIEKASINIQRHSMWFGSKEYCKWIDDSYLLIGKAFFYKQEYPKAKRTFEFVINQYKDGDKKYEAMIWLANTYNQTKKYSKALSMLDIVKSEIDKGMLKKADRSFYYLVRADHYIRQEKYTIAREAILDALYVGQKKKIDTRLRFILGQIHQQDNELYKASEYYTQVIKRNPPYEMAFNASINLARCYEEAYGSGKSIVKKLEKMLKEDKNKDFRDQIYYALAEVAFKNKSDSLAIEYLRLSVAASTTNNFQKVRSSLMLGDIYFKVPKYKLSQAYYDTAMTVISEDYPDYKKISEKTANLSELVENLIVVEKEDSLQRLAAMPEPERLAIIDKIIEAEKKKQEEQAALEQQMAFNQNMNFPNQGFTGGQPTGSPTGSGGWYFYNPATLSQGFTEFTRIWGRRKLEDIWRLSNKTAVIEDQGDDDLAANDSIPADSAKIVSTDPLKRETYLQDIPMSEEDMAASNLRISDALYNLGTIYKDKLENYAESAKSYESLLERYPENEYLLEVYFALYRIYTQLNDAEKAKFYSDLVVAKFPESDFAKILTNPDYYKELENKRNASLHLYSDTYLAYTNGDFLTVLGNCNTALATYTEPAFILPKFEYLRALALGKTDVTDSLKVALKQLVSKYPDSEVVPLAQNILDYIENPGKNDGSPGENKPGEEKVTDIYAFKKNIPHMFMLVIDEDITNIEALKVRMSDFNIKNFSLANLNISDLLLNQAKHLIMVGSFKELDDAMGYYRAMKNDNYVLTGIPAENYTFFMISNENYPIYYKDKDTNKYFTFFKKFYLEGE